MPKSPALQTARFKTQARLLTLILGLLAVFAAAPLPAANGAALPPAVAGQIASFGKARIILHLRTRGPGAANAAQAQETVLAHLAPLGIARIKRIPDRPFLALTADAAQLEQLRQDPDITAIEEDRLLRPSLGSTGPVIGAPSAWTLGATGAGQMVAILDTGVDVNHEYFFGKTTLEACYSTSDPANGVTPLCPGGGTSQTGVGAAAPCSGLSGCDHGTHVAGIATGNGDGLGRPSGVAKDADLLAIQVFSKVDDPAACGSSNPCILAYDSDILSAMSHVQSLAASQPIVAVNLSLGGGVASDAWSCDFVQTFGGGWTPSAMKTAIDDLRNLGIATVIAAGNDGNATGLSWPGCISSAVSVGATDDGDNPAWFTNAASWMVVFAPGVSVDSSVPGNSYGNKSGTSMATPQVTGAIAALEDRAADQGLSPGIDNIIAALTETGVPVTDSGNGMTFPRIQVDAAANRLDPAQILPTEIILDSDYDGAVTGGSFSGFSSSQAYRGLARRGTGAGVDRFRFSPTLPQAGYYDVQAWWPASAANSAQTQVDITHSGGTASQAIDQTTAGGRWNDLGTYYFNADGSAAVEFTEAGSGDLIVDALRLRGPVQPTPLALETASLPSAILGSPYEAQIVASGSVLPYTWSTTSGQLPPGLSLDSASGRLDGIPGQTGTFSFGIQVAGADGQTDQRIYELRVDSQDAFAFADDFSDGTLDPWQPLQSGEIGLVNDPADGWVLRKTAHADPNGGFAPLSAPVSDFELVLYSRKVTTDPSWAWLRYSLTDPSGNGYGIALIQDTGALILERRDAWTGTTLQSATAVPGGLAVGPWYTLRLTRQGNTLTAEAYAGRVDPASATPLATVTTTDAAYTAFSQVNVNGGYTFDTQNVRLTDLGGGTPPPLTVTTTQLPDAVLGTPYDQPLAASGGTPPYTWSLLSGSLPPGLVLSASGAITGSPTATGTFPFEVQVTDDNGDTATQTLTLVAATFADDFSDGTLDPWQPLQSGEIGLVNDPADGWVLRKTAHADPNGGFAPLSAPVSDFELVLYSRKVTTDPSWAWLRYSLTDPSGNGYGIALIQDTGALILERRDAWTGTTLQSATAVPGGLAVGPWYTLRLTRQGNTLTAEAYAGRVDPASATPLATVTTTDAAYTAFSQVNVNGGYTFDTQKLRIY